MKLIIGLGNPGKEYDHTRHNVGFLAVDNLCKQWSFAEFSQNKKFEAEISEGTVSGEKILLIKPSTFMNLSGVAVRKIMDFYKLSPADILVIQDDLDILFGTYRLATDSSSAGHNGIKSIIEHLGTQTFTRLRIGIKLAERCQLSAHDFVLAKFTPEEQKALEETVLPNIEKEVQTFLTKKLPA